MAEQSNAQPSRTNREFVEQLTAWGFVQRKEDGPHLVLRGPHGGTLRVVRSLLGRADTGRVEKASGLLGVTIDRFWAGTAGAAPAVPAGGHDVDTGRSDASASNDTRCARDRVTALVLGVHATADRPLGFDQVVELAGQQITRDQVRGASAHLCREGDLDRIRSGVYQWSGGVRARTQSEATAQPTPVPAPRTAAARLFDQLFPDGVHMTADLLVDLERWSELTDKLARHAS